MLCHPVLALLDYLETSVTSRICNRKETLTNNSRDKKIIKTIERENMDKGVNREIHMT